MIVIIPIEGLGIPPKIRSLYIENEIVKRRPTSAVFKYKDKSGEQTLFSFFIPSGKAVGAHEEFFICFASIRNLKIKIPFKVTLDRYQYMTIDVRFNWTTNTLRVEY